jgi:hypothetical protein
MKDYGLSPREWGELTRLQKRILHYARIMEKFYLGRIHADMDAKRKRKAGHPDVMAAMPRTMPRKRW